jgi:hypothetical protein
VKTRTVLLWGGNLVMSTIGASLQRKPEFQLATLKEGLPGILAGLETAPPDVILFDLGAAQPDFVIPLLRRHPKILLIGVDLTNNTLLVLSGKPSGLLTVEDLVTVIENRLSAEEAGCEPSDSAVTGENHQTV